MEGVHTSACSGDAGVSEMINVSRGCANQAHHFISASTHRREPWLGPEGAKACLCQEMGAQARHLGVVLSAWVLLDDHYHVLIAAEDGEAIPRWVREVHSRTSRWRNSRDGTPGQRNWYQYWDRLMRSEGDFWSRVNYIHFNPVKHGYVDGPEDYRWSSIREYQHSDDEALELLGRFPAPRHLPGDVRE